MTVQDYPLGMCYGATDPPYGTPSYPFHRGDDYKCPPGTPLDIGGQVIGLSGQSGMAIGPHCHVQEWTGGVLNTRKPQNMFQPGLVFETGEASQWGKFITIANADGWKTTYCHLSQINVTAGEEIGATMFNEGDRINFNVELFGEDIGALKSLVGKDWKEAGYELIKPENVDPDKFMFHFKVNDGDVANINTTLGTTTAADMKAQNWKTVFYVFVANNVPAGETLQLSEKLNQIKELASQLNNVIKE